MKNFKQGILNLWYWLPIIWRDRNWDHFYIWEILEHKLKAQAKYIAKEDRHLNAQTDARNLRICAKLIERVKDGYYEVEYQDYAEEEFRFIPCDKEGFKELKIDIISEHYDDYFTKYRLVYQRVLKAHPNEEKHVLALHIAQENHRRAKRLLFKIMEEQIESWWD